MNGREADVCVVGAGIMGVAAAWHLCRRGKRVALFEQFGVDHVRGSSHGAARIFRLAYPVTDYVRLAQMALPVWRDLERELGATVLETTGAVDFGPAVSIDELAGALGEAGADFERLTVSSAGERFGVAAIPDHWEAILQPDGGVSYADTARAGLIELVRESGAEVLADTKVERLRPGKTGVTLETSRGDWRAASAVVAAGGWSNSLLTPLGLQVPISVTREVVLYYRKPSGATIRPSIWHSSPNNPFYWLPNGPRAEVKGGWHGTGPEIDPNVFAAAEPAQEQGARDFFAEHLPALGPDPLTGETCLYASTPDDDFIIDRDGPLIIGAGFGGHGFKFGPLVGRLLADLVDGTPPLFAERFALTRFSRTATA